MNNLRELDLIKNTNLSDEIKYSIENHCYGNSIEKAMKNIQNSIDIDYDRDWEPEILIFNYVSKYLKTMFPFVFENKTNKENLDIIYEGIKEFLYQRKREEQIPRILSKLKRVNQESIEKVKKEKKKVMQKILALFV